MNDDIQQIWETYTYSRIAETNTDLVARVEDALHQNPTFSHFLQSLIQGQPTLKQLADKVSYVSLYTMNKHGIGGDSNSLDQKLSRLLQTISLYFHQVIMWPLVQPLRQQKDELYSDARMVEHKRNISQQRRQALDRGDRELASKILQKLKDIPPDIRKSLDDLEDQIRQFEVQANNTPITKQHLTPVDDVSQKTFDSAQHLFDQLQNIHDV